MTDENMQEGVADVSVRIKGSSSSPKPSGFRCFVGGMFKIALAITIAGLILGGIAAGIAGSIYWHEQSKNRALANPKFHNEITVPSLDNAKFTLLTKWQDSQIYYQLQVHGYPSEIKKYFEASPYQRNSYASFTIVLSDVMGFKIDDIRIPLTSMTRIVGATNTYSGLSIKDSAYMSADKYRQISSWEIEWSL